MAAKTTLNAKNLETLGAERLAALVLEVAEGDAARKRIARAALLEAAGGSALSASVSKRLVSLRRAKSWVGSGKRRAFIDDLDRQRDLIATRIAADAPKEAYDLIWRFMALADPVHHRIDDGSGAVGDVFRHACRNLGAIAAKAKPKPEALAEQVFRAITEANAFDEFDGLIEAAAPALGEVGLASLRVLLKGAKGKDAPAHRGLLDIADASGDVDAYIAEHSADQRQNPFHAAAIAERLVSAERADEALAILDGAEPARDSGRAEWTEARLLALEASGRVEEARTLRWDAFARALDPDMLRAHLKDLPDFEDDEAEDRALDLVESGEDIHAALAFLIDWPAHHRAAALIRDRRNDLDGDRYYRLGPAADALEATEPLAATLLLRAMIEYTLDQSKSSRYGHAARHLQTCEFLAGVIETWEDVEPHDAYLARLRKYHSRKDQFWYRVSS